MKISISEAARRAGTDRSAIYRKIKSSALSKESDADGKPVVDLSELARIYPKVVADPVRHDTVDDSNKNSLLQAEVQHLRERLEDAIEDRNRWRGVAERALLVSPQPAQTKERRGLFAQFWRGN